jgi:alpha-N-arabinofuranosidase
MDGVGPREQRPRRRDLAWKSIETNQFGTNEFLEFCKRLGTQPMLGVNMGTGSSEEAAALVEYCNAPPGSYYADLRVKHGYPEPRGIQYWCLGNEMDGPWQIGHLEAAEYGRKALETAKMMRWHDPSVQLILCGSSSTGMRTYPEWDRITLSVLGTGGPVAACTPATERRHGQLPGSGCCRRSQIRPRPAALYQGKLRSKHEVYLSWVVERVVQEQTDGQWQEAPRDQRSTTWKTLVVGQWMNMFLRHCSLKSPALLISHRAHPDVQGRTAARHFYPFSVQPARPRRGAGCAVPAPVYETGQFSVPVLDVSAS